MMSNGDYDYEEDVGGDNGVSGAVEVGAGDVEEEDSMKSVVLFDDTTDEEEEEIKEEQEKKMRKDKDKVKKKDKDEEVREEKRKRAKDRRAKKRAECPDHFSKYRVINQVRYWDEFVLEEYEATDVRGACIVSGFFTESIAAGFAAQFLVEELNLPLIGTIHAEKGMPICVVNANQPSDIVRIYGNRSLVVFTSQKILGSDLSKSVVYAVYDYARRHHCDQIITLEAFPKELNIKVDTSDESEIIEKLKKTTLSNKTAHCIRFLTNDAATGKMLHSAGHKQIRGALITGVTGGILAKASTCELKVVGLICPYNPIGGQSRATILLVELVATLANITVQTTILEDEAEEMELEILKQFEKSSKAKPLKHPSMYI